MFAGCQATMVIVYSLRRVCSETEPSYNLILFTREENDLIISIKNV